MPRARTRIYQADLVNGSLVREGMNGRIYRLGEPKKKNVNLNVVNHCQLYHPKTGKLCSNEWYNMTNLRDLGFKYYGPAPKKRAAPTTTGEGKEGGNRA